MNPNRSIYLDENNIFHYILIADPVRQNHLTITKSIQSILPYSIIESIYDLEELKVFMENKQVFPSIVFIDPQLIDGSDILKPFADEMCDTPFLVKHHDSHAVTGYLPPNHHEYYPEEGSIAPIMKRVINGAGQKYFSSNNP